MLVYDGLNLIYKCKIRTNRTNLYIQDFNNNIFGVIDQ